MRGSIFDSTMIGNLRVRNSVVRAAVTEGRFDADGRVADHFLSLYRDMANSGIGVIITGMMAVSPLDHHLNTMIRLYTQEGRDDLKKLVDVVHSEGGTIIAQLSAIGSQLPKNLVRPGAEVISPSGVTESVYKTESREMTIDEIQKLVREFAQAVKTAKDVGADGVELQCSHGYLLSHFLTPYYNKRTDEYGGSLENRSRIILEILKVSRELVGPVFPIWIKINCQDFMDSGNFTTEDCKTLLPMLEKAGASAIEVSGGSASARFNEGVIRLVTRTKAPMYFVSYARDLAKTVSIPVGVVGGFRSVKELESVYGEDHLAFVSMCRPFIRENRLMARWLEGKTEDAYCVSCNRCLQYSDKGVYCIFDPARPI